MVALALASAVLVLGDILFRQRLVGWGVFSWVVWIDLAITGIFVIEFFGVKDFHCSGTESSGKMASTGQTASQAPQSMHSSGLM